MIWPPWKKCFTVSEKVKHIPTRNTAILLLDIYLREMKAYEHKTYTWMLQFTSVQSLSRVRLFATPWIAARQASLSNTNSRSSLTHVHQVSDAIQPSYPLLSPSLADPSISQHQSLFQCVNSSQQWPKYWNFSFSIIPSKEHPELISFRMHWLDVPAVKGTLKSFLQHHSSKTSILRHSAFFTVQLSHPYMTTGKTIALTDGPLLAK